MRLARAWVSALVVGIAVPQAFAGQSPSPIPARNSEDAAADALKTMSRMGAVALCLDKFAARNGRFPTSAAPAELPGMIGQEVCPGRLLSESLVDAWGTALRIQLKAGGQGYQIVSAGADRRFEPSSWSQPGETSDPRQDIVLEDRRFIRSCRAWALNAVATSKTTDPARELRAEVELGHARRTMSDTRAMATAIEAYAIDNLRYPQAATMDELARLLESTYIFRLPRTDGWDTPFQYVVSSDRRTYRIVSAGADRKFDGSRASGVGESRDFSEDAIYENGKFVTSWKTDTTLLSRPTQVFAEFQLMEQGLKSFRKENEIAAAAAQATSAVVDRTMADIRALATAVEAYSVDENHYPAAAGLDELARLLEPKYIHSAPRADAWGTPFRFIVSKDREHYKIVSAGSDRTFDEASWAKPGASANLADDIVYADGTFTRYFAPSEVKAR